MTARYYNMCCKGVGRPVAITTRDGNIHRGIITRVDKNKVFIRPLGNRKKLGGLSYGFGGYRGYGGYGRYGGYGWGIALAAIAAFAFLPFFFW